MSEKKTKLDPATVAVAKRVLAMPPKRNKDLKVGRDEGKRKVKDRAASSKPRSA